MKPFVKQLSVAELLGKGILNIADDQPLNVYPVFAVAVLVYGNVGG